MGKQPGWVRTAFNEYVNAWAKRQGGFKLGADKGKRLVVPDAATRELLWNDFRQTMLPSLRRLRKTAGRRVAAGNRPGRGTPGRPLGVRTGHRNVHAK